MHLLDYIQLQYFIGEDFKQPSNFKQDDCVFQAINIQLENAKSIKKNKLLLIEGRTKTAKPLLS